MIIERNWEMIDNSDISEIPMEDRLKVPLWWVEKSVRLSKLLMRMRLYTIADLTKTSMWEFKRQEGSGCVTWNEIKEVTEELGVHLALDNRDTRSQRQIVQSIEKMLKEILDTRRV